MPNITFTVTTDVIIKRLELDEYDHYVPVQLNGGVGHAQLASGYEGVAILYLRGNQGQKAKLKITQQVGAETVTLAERTGIRITSAGGQSVSYVAFQVR
ncbi:MAG TPA: hypothetical protein VD887_13560 [Allosphingosinicella sp.]|nr:hypothetical protein [Allosphingosinicella sp.]HYG31227.1 hypothetical protein [Allosphingosinicella sp.]